MQKQSIFNILKTPVIGVLILSMAGCKGYLDDPFIDKETGEDINLLIVDFNFFTTRMTYKIMDASNGSLINDNVTISFSGKNKNDIVDFSGNRIGQFTTAQGQVELTVDPNIAISGSSPLEFAIQVNADGYNPLTKGIQIPEEGIKTFELYLSKVSDEDDSSLTGNIDTSGGDTTFVFMAQADNMKSAAAEVKDYVINYSISMNSLLKFRDTQNNLLFNSSTEVMEAYNSNPEFFMKMYLATYSSYMPGVEVVKIQGVEKNVILHKLETGRLKSLVIGGKEVGSLGQEGDSGIITSTCSYLGETLPDLFGFMEFEEQYWVLVNSPRDYTELHFEYTVAKASDENLCSTGSSITFESEAKSSFSIDADIYDLNGNFITSMNFKGNFPETFQLNNVPSVGGKLVFRDNNPSFQAIPPLEMDNLCSGNQTIDVKPASGYVGYQIVLKALCRDNLTVAIAPTYSGEVKVKGSEDPWQGVNMIGGVTDVLGLPGKEYELRLLWKDDWEYSTYATQFDAEGNYTGPDYDDATITSSVLEDGRVQIKVDVIFNQDICTDMGW